MAIVFAGMTSCNDYLDKTPDNRMELKNKDDVASLLVSAYPTTYPAYLLEMYSDNTDEYRNTPGDPAGFPEERLYPAEGRSAGRDGSLRQALHGFHGCLQDRA